MHSTYHILRDKQYNDPETKRLTPEGIKALEAAGMVPRDQLEDRTYYIGVCRNARVAIWVEKTNEFGEAGFPNNEKEPCFFHLREKLGRIFTESIKHPAYDDGFDCFIPLQKINIPEDL